MSPNVLGIIITCFVGFLTLAFLIHELRVRSSLQKDQLDFEKERLEIEKEIRSKRIQEEERERKERKEWLDRETIRITRLSDEIGEQVADKLKKDVKWASESLERAKIKPRAQSLFADRIGHFRDEKKFLADSFVPHLLSRCKTLVGEGFKVYVVIDSGTTLYSFFENIGRETVRCYENKEAWINNLFIATNNLPGIDNIMESGRISPGNRYSDLAVKCHLLPGVPLPIYSTVTGDETNEALERLKKNAGENAFFIGLVTGNWIRLRRNDPPCPVPLARGLGHRKFKQVLIDQSDEIYVVTPLGKILVKVPPDEVNKALGYSEENTAPDRKPYHEVKIDREKAKFVKIVTTSRNSNRILHQLSQTVNIVIGDENICNGLVRPLTLPQHLIFPFDDLPDKEFQEFEVEFPHPHTRKDDFIKKFFYVDALVRRNKCS